MNVRRRDVVSASVFAMALAATAPALAEVTEPGYMTVPGANTAIKWYGFARLDMVKDIDQGLGAAAAANYSGIGLDGSPQDRRKGNFTITAKFSRLGIRARTSTAAGVLDVVAEGDFSGEGGNELITNSSGFRIRNAYASLGPILVGQMWTNAADLESYPEFVDSLGPIGVPGYIRQGQFRYTPFNGTHFLSLSLENAESDFFSASRAVGSAGSTPYSPNTLDKWPDVTIRYAMKGSWGRVALAGVARHLGVDTGGATINAVNANDSAFGYGAILSGVLKVGPADKITLMAMGGDGLGRYVYYNFGSSAAVVDSSRRLRTIKSYSANVSYQHSWSDKLRSNVDYGYSRWENPTPFVSPAPVRTLQSAYVNLIYVPVPNSWIGLEYVNGKLEVDAPTNNHGEGNRLYLVFQYGF